MKGVEWEFIDDEGTRKFREKRKERGFYKPDDSLQGIYMVAEPSTVKDRNGVVHQISKGEMIKIFDDSNAGPHKSEDWLMLAERVLVDYGQNVESLRPGTYLTIFQNLESEK